MALINEKDRAVLRDEFAKMSIPVKLIMFTQAHECDYCRDTRTLAGEIAVLSEYITLEVYDFVEESKLAETYGVDKLPALSITRGGDDPKDYGIRYFGIPSGYEFSSLIQDIVMVGTGDSGLMPETKDLIAKMATPLHFQVFVTPTCPYCPGAVRLAHQLAMESDLITGDMVEAIEFPHLSMKYQVQGVPRTVVNENMHIEGAVPEAMLMTRIGDLLEA